MFIFYWCIKTMNEYFLKHFCKYCHMYKLQSKENYCYERNWISVYLFISLSVCMYEYLYIYLSMRWFFASWNKAQQSQSISSMMQSYVAFIHSCLHAIAIEVHLMPGTRPDIGAPYPPKVAILSLVSPQTILIVPLRHVSGRWHCRMHRPQIWLIRCNKIEQEQCRFDAYIADTETFTWYTYTSTLSCANTHGKHTWTCAHKIIHLYL